MTTYQHILRSGILFLSLIAFNAFAQNVKAPLFSPVPSKETAMEILKRPVVICKREVGEKEAEKLSKKDPDQLQFMDTYNKYFNETLKLYFDTLYEGSKDIQVKSVAEVNVLVESHSNKVAVLQAENLRRSFWAGRNEKEQETFSFRLFLPDGKEDDQGLLISFTNDILTDADFVFLIQQINIHLQKISAGEQLPSYDYTNKNQAQRLKDLKLIVNLDKVNEKLTKEEIQSNYSYPMEFVGRLETYEDIVTGRKAGYAYITEIWSTSVWGLGYVAVDASNGEILCILGSGSVHFSIGIKESSGTKRPKAFARGHDIVSFKPKYSLKAAHFKYFNKFASEAGKKSK